MYRVEPAHPTVAGQIDALPYEALAGYADAIGVMEVDPWSGRPWDVDKPDGNIRILPLGLGQVVYLILERDREVHVLEVQWAG